MQCIASTYIHRIIIEYISFSQKCVSVLTLSAIWKCRIVVVVELPFKVHRKCFYDEFWFSRSITYFFCTSSDFLLIQNSIVKWHGCDLWLKIHFIGRENPFSIENGKRIYATFLSLWLFCLFDSTVQIQFPTSVPIISCHHTIVHKIITVNSRYIIQPAHILISSESRQSLSFQMKFKKKTSEILNKSFFFTTEYEHTCTKKTGTNQLTVSQAFTANGNSTKTLQPVVSHSVFVLIGNVWLP